MTEDHDVSPEAPRRLYRSRRDRVLGGVCGGLGHYLGIDPVLIRIGFVALAIAGGSGVIAYLIAWVVIPETPGDDGAPAGGVAVDTNAARLVIGAILVAFGLVLLFGIEFPRLGRYLPPLVLVGIGVLVMLGGRRQ